MENFDQPIDVGMAPGKEDGLRITPEIRHYWQQSSTWAMFFAIVLFVLFGLVSLLMLYAALATGVSGLVGGLLAVALYGAILFFPGLYYYRFSTQMKQALATEDTGLLDQAFINLKLFYRYTGILVIVVLSLYFVVLLVFGAAFLRSGGIPTN